MFDKARTLKYIEIKQKFNSFKMILIFIKRTK